MRRRMSGLLNQLGEELYTPDEFDPRYTPRVGDPAYKKPTVEDAPVLEPAPRLRLSDLEGESLMSTMSDRTRAGGLLTRIGNDYLAYPIPLTGGQDWMRTNPSMWASGRGPVANMIKAAQGMKEKYGKDPLFGGWRMTPTGSDFAGQMTGGTMMSYAAQNMPRSAKNDLNRLLKLYIPSFVGVDSPMAPVQFAALPDEQRKMAMSSMDKLFRKEGGISLPQARLAIADQTQINAPTLGFQNIGRFDTSQGPLTGQGNLTYPDAIAGNFLGRLDSDVNLIDLNPTNVYQGQSDSGGFGRSILVDKDGVFRDVDDPEGYNAARRSAEINPYGVFIDEALLTDLDNRGFKVSSNPIAGAATGLLAAGLLSQSEEADASPAGLLDKARTLGMNTDMPLFHGTTHSFDAFDGSITNPESDWGRGTYATTSPDDVSVNYAGEGPDLTGRIARQTEIIADEMGLDYDDPKAIKAAREQLVGKVPEGQVLDLYARTEKYAEIGGDNPTYYKTQDYRADAAEEIKREDYDDEFDYEDAITEYADQLASDDMDSPYNKILYALQRSAVPWEDQSVILDSVVEQLADGEINLTELDNSIRSNVKEAYDNEDNLIPAGAVSSEVLQELGYEGVIDRKVADRFKNMQGMDSETAHVITFPSFESNLRRTDAEFDPAKRDSSNLLAGTAGAGVLGSGFLQSEEAEAGPLSSVNKAAQKTQRANTVATAKKANQYLDNMGATGRSLDYGAGFGINAEAIKFDDTFEPFPAEGFNPTFMDPASIPKDSYGRLISTNVLNVIPPTAVIDGVERRLRDEAVQNIGESLTQGGVAVIQVRDKAAIEQLMKSKGSTIEQGEPVAVTTSTGSYQKGFTNKELKNYVADVLGDGYEVQVIPSKAGISGSAITVKRVAPALLGAGLLGAPTEEAEASFVGEASKLGRARKPQLEEAKKMLGKKPTRREIADVFQETGWEFNVADGKWRTELPNVKTRIEIPKDYDDYVRGQKDWINRQRESGDLGTMPYSLALKNAIRPSRKYKLGEVLNDPYLLSQYDEKVGPDGEDFMPKTERGLYAEPQDDALFYGSRNRNPLSDVNVQFSTDVGKGAMYEPDEDLITLPSSTDALNLRSTALHELQHAIQEREGFATGGMPEQFASMAARTEWWQNPSEYWRKRGRKIPKGGYASGPQAVKRMKAQIKQMGEPDVGEWSAEDFQRYSDLNDELERYELFKKDISKYRKDIQYGNLTDYDAYRNLTGEMEANNVSFRDQQRSDPYAYEFLKDGELETDFGLELFTRDIPPPIRTEVMASERYTPQPREKQIVNRGRDDFNPWPTKKVSAKSSSNQQAFRELMKPNMVERGMTLAGEGAIRTVEAVGKEIVGALGSFVSPKSQSYKIATGIPSVMGKPTGDMKAVIDKVSTSFEDTILPAITEIANAEWTDPLGRERTIKGDLTNAITPIMEFYQDLPEWVKSNIGERIGYGALAALSMWGITDFGLKKRAAKEIQNSVRESSGGLLEEIK